MTESGPGRSISEFAWPTLACWSRTIHIQNWLHPIRWAGLQLGFCCWLITASCQVKTETLTTAAVVTTNSNVLTGTARTVIKRWWFRDKVAWQQWIKTSSVSTDITTCQPLTKSHSTQLRWILCPSLSISLSLFVYASMSACVSLQYNHLH